MIMSIYNVIFVSYRICNTAVIIIQHYSTLLFLRYLFVWCGAKLF